jgi:hypothetical protein
VVHAAYNKISRIFLEAYLNFFFLRIIMNTEIRNCMYRAYSVKFDLLFSEGFSNFFNEQWQTEFFFTYKKVIFIILL